MDLKNLFATEEAQYEFNGHKINLSIKSGGPTRAYIKKLRKKLGEPKAAIDEDDTNSVLASILESSDFYVEILKTFIAAWDIEHEGKPLPIDDEGISLLPLALVSGLGSFVVNGGGKSKTETPTNTSNGSEPTSSSEASPTTSKTSR